MSGTLRNDDRLHELLADHALLCVDRSAQSEIDELLRDPEIERLAEEYELVAAMIDPALTESSPIALPESIANSVRIAGISVARTAANEKPPIPDDAPVIAGRIGMVPWLVAAAAVLVAFVSLLQPRSESAPDPVIARLALQETPGTVTIPWQALEDSTASGFVSGDVVWNNAAQTGFMRFQGLAANDPSVEQYQLWIFDADRDEARPVDGGVFNVAWSGEVVVPIDAKIFVHEAAAFAVTVERPGGVVVSDRSRLALLAAPTDQG
jgi:hypothetical protein